MLDDAEVAAFEEIARYVQWAVSQGLDADPVVDTVYSILTRSYNLELQKDVFKQNLLEHVQGVYKAEALPRVNFTLVDTRAMVYLKDSNLVYLGKFVTNLDVKRRMCEFLRVAYIENGRAIGNSPTELRAFMEAFKDQLSLDRWQARRIVDTTVGRSRVFGELIAYKQAAGKTYRISGPMDQLTCPYCAAMVGREFSVASSLDTMERAFTQGPEMLPSILPFLSKLPLEQVQNASDADLQDAGFALPPFHGNCRHFTTLVESYKDWAEVPYSIE